MYLLLVSKAAVCEPGTRTFCIFGKKRAEGFVQVGIDHYIMLTVTMTVQLSS